MALTSYPRKVQTLVADLEENWGVTVREMDGNHHALYNGDRSTRPFKIAAGRPEEKQVRYLVGWATKTLPGYPDGATPTDSSNERQDDMTAPSPDRTWVVFNHGQDDERTSSYIYKEGSRYYCTCGAWEKDSLVGAHKHEGKHTGAAARASAQSAATRKAMRAAAHEAAVREETEVQHAARVLARHFGVGADEEELTSLRKRVADLEAALSLVREATAL